LIPEGVLVHDEHLGQVTHLHAFEQALLPLGQRRLELNPGDHVRRRRHDDVLARERFAVGASDDRLVRSLFKKLARHF